VIRVTKFAFGISLQADGNVAADEEAHLAGMQANNEDTREHICFEIRNLARWARQQKQ
jgi:hypothetical protein